MPYVGKAPVSGGFHKLDALTASATATYALTLGSAAYFPETANQLLVSLNGVIQAPQDSFTVSGSNLIFDTALTSNDSIDFVVALGDVLGVGSVTDGAITTAKIGNNAVTSAKLATTIAPTNLETTSSTFKMTDLTSNAFYRTGLWTPIVSGDDATDKDATIFSTAAATAYGTYTRIGNLVTVSWTYINGSGTGYTNNGSDASHLRIVGLPFKLKNVSTYNPGGVIHDYLATSGWAAGYTPMTSGIYNTKKIILHYANGAVMELADAVYWNVASAKIAGSLVYETDEA